MKRMLLLASLFFLSVGTASADYVHIKININQLDFFPPAIVAGAQNAGMTGAPMNPNPGGGVLGAPMPPGTPPPMMPEDPNAKWVSVYVEFKSDLKPVGKTELGGGVSTIHKYDHRWGRGVWLAFSPHFPIHFARVPADSYAAEFDAGLKKELKEKGKKKTSESIEGFLHLARKALSRSRLGDFRRVLDEAEKLDPKDAIVANCVRVRKALEKPFKDMDPAQTELLAQLPKGYKVFNSEDKGQGHYAIYAQVFETDTVTKNVIRRRLNMMENSLQIFYYWFALQGNATTQPALPKHKLIAVMTKDREEFLIQHLQWGGLPMVADGFTPRRENVIIMSSKTRLNDPRYAEFDGILTNKLAEANGKLQPFLKASITREDLLTGRINEVKAAGQAAIFIAAAQTAVLVSRAMEDESERATITNEAIRQLLIASEMFPRNVQIPDWMVEGLAGFFETPIGAVYPTVASPSWTHLISFKHLRKLQNWDAKDSRDTYFKRPEVLFNIISDRYFREAREVSAKAMEARDNGALRHQADLSWELARCTAWAFVYHLAENRQLDRLFKYGKELDKLPRDMDLNESVLQACFARGFDITDPKDSRRIQYKPFEFMAGEMFNTLQRANLDLGDFQKYSMLQRELLDAEFKAISPEGVPPVGLPTPPPIQPNPPPIQPNPPPVQPNPNPNPPAKAGIRPPGPGGGRAVQPAGQLPAGLENSTWIGQESLTGYDKLEFRFQANGQVVMIDSDGMSAGSYTAQNNTVTLTFYNGTVVYTGTINGQTLAGNAQNGAKNWTFSVRR